LWIKKKQEIGKITVTVGFLLLMISGQ